AVIITHRMHAGARHFEQRPIFGKRLNLGATVGQGTRDDYLAGAVDRELECRDVAQSIGDSFQLPPGVVGVTAHGDLRTVSALASDRGKGALARVPVIENCGNAQTSDRLAT